MTQIEKTKELYNELLEREKYLKGTEQTEQVVIRLSELMLVTVRVQQLILHDIDDGFIYVKNQEPPINTELIAQDPNGKNHLTRWRESYKIFMCQNKQEISYDWKWKKI